MPKEYINLNVDDDNLKMDKGLQENSKLKVWLTKANAYQCIEYGSMSALKKKGEESSGISEEIGRKH